MTRPVGAIVAVGAVGGSVVGAVVGVGAIVGRTVGVAQRKVLSPNDSLSLDELGRRIVDFQARYEESATPFEWKFTRHDLQKLPAVVGRFGVILQPLWADSRRTLARFLPDTQASLNVP